jgi:hypothetical protein
MEGHTQQPGPCSACQHDGLQQNRAWKPVMGGCRSIYMIATGDGAQKERRDAWVVFLLRRPSARNLARPAPKEVWHASATTDASGVGVGVGVGVLEGKGRDGGDGDACPVASDRLTWWGWFLPRHAPAINLQPSTFTLGSYMLET